MVAEEATATDNENIVEGLFFRGCHFAMAGRGLIFLREMRSAQLKDGEKALSFKGATWSVLTLAALRLVADMPLRRNNG